MTVYLVGAGIGEIDYLTIKAKRIISQAEVLIYDDLVAQQILNLVPQNCLKINVGKRGGKLSTSQDSINQLLVYYGQKAQIVVRLKSGDPGIFGRLNEEIGALTTAECDFELIPGISSALAAPLLAGISLTDKIDSKYFAVVTGNDPNTLDWQTLAKIDTLVILMGAKTLPIIVQKILENGASFKLPIAIIRNCGHKNQQIWIGILANIVEKTANISLSPAIIIIGKVVEKQKMSNYTDSFPLASKTILVTRAASQSNDFRNLLEAKGATVIEMPALVIQPPSNWDDLDKAINNLSEFNWLILTSANAVEYFFKRLNSFNKDARFLSKIKIAVVGKKTAEFLEKYSLKPDFIPPNFVADSLVETFPESLNNQQILFPRVETGGREILVQELTKKGAKVFEVAAYQSGCPTEIDPIVLEALQDEIIDIITFASSKTVKNFHQLITNEMGNKFQISLDSLLEKVCLASIGPETSKTCNQLLGRVDIEAKEYTLEGLIEAIITIDN